MVKFSEKTRANVLKGQVSEQTAVKWSIIKVADKGSRTVAMDIPLSSTAKQEREMTLVLGSLRNMNYKADFSLFHLKLNAVIAY